MSIYYNSESFIYADFNQETIYKILKKCDEKGYIFLDQDYNIVNLQKAILCVLVGIDDPKYHVIHIKKNQNNLESIIFFPGKDILKVSLSISDREYVLSGFDEKECIQPSKFLLDITSDFQLQNFFITHDMDGLFENSIDKNKFYVSTHSTYCLDVMDFFNFKADNLPRGYNGKKFLKRDAFYIIRQLQNIGCSFIAELDTEINQDELIKKIADMLLTPKNSVSEENGLIIKTANGSLIKATFFNYAFQFLPLHPWTMKKIEGRDSIDVAYYTKILLAMAEPFGIIELATHCNNAFYE